MCKVTKMYGERKSWGEVVKLPKREKEWSKLPYQSVLSVRERM